MAERAVLTSRDELPEARVPVQRVEAEVDLEPGRRKEVRDLQERLELVDRLLRLTDEGDSMACLCATAKASRSNLARVSGSAASDCGSTFIATSRFSFESLVRYTSPIPPAPMGARIS
jgi:hypothetical protein